MTREKTLEKIDTKYDKKLGRAEETLTEAQMAVDLLVAEKVALIEEVNEYHDALDDKERVDVIIAKGEPVI